MLTKQQINEGLSKAYENAGHNAYFGNGFEAGVHECIASKYLNYMQTGYECTICGRDMDLLDE